MLAPITAGKTLTIDLPNTGVTFAAGLKGAGSIIKTGNYELTVAGASTLTSASSVTVNAGSLKLSSAGTLGAATLVVDGGSFVNSTLEDLANPIQFGATAGFSGGGKQNTGAVTLLANSTVTFDGTTTLAGVISGAKTLTIAGNPGAQVTLSGTNTYTGGTTLNGTTVTAGSLDAFGAGAIAVNLNATLDLGDFTLANAITLTGGRIQATSAGTAGTLTTAQLTAQSGTIAAVITGTDFVKTGAGLLILDAENTYTGSTTVTGGTLRPSFPDAIPAESVVNVTGGTFDLNLGSLTNTINVAGGTLANGIVDLSQLNATTGLVSADIEGTLGFIKDSPGTLVLSGSNTFTGVVDVLAGTLQLGSTDALGANAVTVDGGILDLGQQTIANAITLDAGTIANGSLTLGQLTANAGTVAAVLTGTGGFTRNGTGILTLSGANTFTDGVFVTAGTLAAGSVGAFGANTVTVNGGTLDLGQQALANSFILNGGSLVNGTLALG